MGGGVDDVPRPLRELARELPAAPPRVAGEDPQAAELGDQLTITKLNVDENAEIAMRFNVMSIPTLLLFDGGDVKRKIVGAKGKSALMQELDEFLATSR